MGLSASFRAYRSSPTALWNRPMNGNTCCALVNTILLSSFCDNSLVNGAWRSHSPRWSFPVSAAISADHSKSRLLEPLHPTIIHTPKTHTTPKILLVYVIFLLVGINSNCSNPVRRCLASTPKLQEDAIS